MTNVATFLRPLAFAVALAAMVGAAAIAYGATENTAYFSTPAAVHQLAANSKGRPAGFAPAGEVAVNSKGRPAEFAPANRQAANSKGRPAEFRPASGQALG